MGLIAIATAPTTVLVIEDDADGRRSVTEALEAVGHTVISAATGAEGLRLLDGPSCDVVLTDVRLPDIDGMTILARSLARYPLLPVLLMTAYGDVASAVTALKNGAYDYLLKPLNLLDIQSKVAHALETVRLRSEVSSLRSSLHKRYSTAALIAHAPAMRSLLDRIRAVAPTRAHVLILGESGTGKELVARALHTESPRAEGPFVAVNCGALSESLLESELFGHEKGAFTGAVQRHPGAFERAHQGTLFLDEIGLAPLSVQARLLRVLEDRTVTRVGGTGPVPFDARIVAASNRVLAEGVNAGNFRHDLLYRLRVVTLALPPLRERREDIRPLAAHFVSLACREHGRHIETVEDDFYQALETQTWPGNVRELKHVVESSVILAPTPKLGAAELSNQPHTQRVASSENDAVGQTLADLEKKAILRALHRHAGSRTLAAEELGLSTRTIQRKIKDYNLPF